MEIMEIMKERHSVRQYQNLAIEQEKREILNQLVNECNREGNLNIQICYDEPECFKGGLAHYGKFEGVNNYIALVGVKSDTLDQRCGYYGEKIVLKAQELGLNTCWVALTHGKSKATMRPGEKQVCLIALGYGKTQGTPSKSKSIEQVSNVSESTPDWFKEGVKAALLAPTAVNQQKFYITYHNGAVSMKVKGIGTLTKMDLGIAKYHFETVTNKKIKD